MITTGEKEFFKGIGQVKYEGPQSDNPLAFRWYDADKMVAGKSMKDHLRFACAYWHSFCGTGADPFGGPTHSLPWNQGADALSRARNKMDAAFELISKMGLPYYCFHDTDLVEFTNEINDNEARLQQITKYARLKQATSGVKLLW